MRRSSTTGLLLSVLLVVPAALQAQHAARPLPSWRAELLPVTGMGQQQRGRRETVPLVPPADSQATRSHTTTGLLIGGIVGAVATTVFLVGFCGDADTKCDADEVGRAVLVFAVPPAVVGALIGSLVRTKR